MAEDKRVNIFYYPIESWTDFIMFNFCMDRGAGHQLEDAMACSYAPWNRTIEGIFKEEMMHVNHGNTWVKKLAESADTNAEVQAALNKWYPRTMNIFGRPNSSKNQIYKRFNLKMRDNEDVRLAFKKDIEQALVGTGLTLPQWTPEYDESV
jgi:ring-1,2-phenylacetyl-CoA epoxidase subunit PaaA